MVAGVKTSARAAHGNRALRENTTAAMPDSGGSTDARAQHPADHGDTHATAGADEQDYGGSYRDGGVVNSARGDIPI
jgi:hypothetical protein